MECTPEGGHVHDNGGCACGVMREEEMERLLLRIENIAEEDSGGLGCGCRCFCCACGCRWWLWTLVVRLGRIHLRPIGIQRDVSDTLYPPLSTS